jgi:hypothetical protein
MAEAHADISHRRAFVQFVATPGAHFGFNLLAPNHHPIVQYPNYADQYV